MPRAASCGTTACRLASRLAGYAAIEPAAPEWTRWPPRSTSAPTPEAPRPRPSRTAAARSSRSTRPRASSGPAEPDFPELPDRRALGAAASPRASSRGSSACARTPRRPVHDRRGAYATQVAEHALGAADRRRARHRPATRGPGRWDRRTATTARGLDGRDRRRRRHRARADRDARAARRARSIAVTRSGRDGTLPVERIGEIWGTADHFVLGAPATDGTRHLVGAAELCR